jgi:hypothetical protein
MWTRIVLKPFWARALVTSGVGAILNAVDWSDRGFAADPYESWLFTLAGHLAGAVIFGLLVAAFTTNSHHAYTHALASLDPTQRSAAVDASFRGPVPVDAPVREAAIRVGQRRLQSALFWRTIWLVLSGWGVLAIVLLVGEWLARGTWPASGSNTHDWISRAVSFAVILGLLIAAWYVPLNIKHRLQMLGQTQIQSPFGTATSSASGWYPDPHDANLMRYFDGRMWTSSTHPRSH